MIVTRAGAHRRRFEEEAEAAIAACPLLRILGASEDMLLEIMRQLPLMRVPRLGTTSKLFYNLSRRGELWVDASFPPAVAFSVTDANLARILNSVDAKTHTRRLSLEGCWQVTGIGLAPLLGSTVLQTLDMRRRIEYDGRVINKDIADGAMRSLVEPMLKSNQLLSLMCHRDELWSLELVPAKTKKPADLSRMCIYCYDGMGTDADVEETIKCDRCDTWVCASCVRFLSECERCGDLCCEDCIDHSDEYTEYACHDCRYIIDYQSDSEDGYGSAG